VTRQNKYLMAVPILKICGPQFAANSTNTPSTVPTNAVAGSNAGSSANIAGGDFTGYGNATPGGATFCYIVNSSGAAANVVVANNGVNVGSVQILANSYLIVEKYSYDTIQVSANLSITPVACRW
jgi:hypothetical protein